MRRRLLWSTTRLLSMMMSATSSAMSSSSGRIPPRSRCATISVIFTLDTTSIRNVQNAIAKGPVQANASSQDGKTQLDVGSLAVVNNQAEPGSARFSLKRISQSEAPRGARRFVNAQLVISTEHNGLTLPLDAIQQVRRGGRVRGRPAVSLRNNQVRSRR
jgi:membrane fusion protein, multidrug efflux system